MALEPELEPEEEVEKDGFINFDVPWRSGLRKGPVTEVVHFVEPATNKKSIMKRKRKLGTNSFSMANESADKPNRF